MSSYGLRNALQNFLASFKLDLWSGRRESNPRPTAWKAVTLPLSYSRPVNQLSAVCRQPQRLKPLSISTLAARLKPCPSQFSIRHRLLAAPFPILFGAGEAVPLSKLKRLCQRISGADDQD